MSFVHRNGGITRTGGTNGSGSRKTYNWCNIKRSIEIRSHAGHQGLLCGIEEKSQATTTRHGASCKQFCHCFCLFHFYWWDIFILAEFTAKSSTHTTTVTTSAPERYTTSTCLLNYCQSLRMFFIFCTITKLFVFTCSFTYTALKFTFKLPVI